MSHPLELSYNWRLPVGMATAGAILFVLALARGGASGWIEVALLIVVLWALFAFVMFRRARSYLMVDGDTLVLRPWRELVRIDGPQVKAVRQVLTARGPSYKLVVDGPDGKPVRYLAPTAWLRGGHSALFSWLVEQAPDAALDKGSRKTLDLLRVRGLIS